MRHIGSTEGIGAPLSPNRVGGDNFIRYIGDRLVLDMHEGAGTTVRDRSGNENNGTFGAGAAAPTWERNRLSFDGGDHMLIPDATSLNPTVDLTIVVFVNFDNDPKDVDEMLYVKTPQSATEGYSLYSRGTSDDFQFDAVTTGGRVIAHYTHEANMQGNWYLVTGRHSSVGNNNVIFLNVTRGTLYATVGTLVINDDPMSIGNKQIGPVTLEFNGLFSFVRINSKAFSALEVQREHLWNKWRN